MEWNFRLDPQTVPFRTCCEDVLLSVNRTRFKRLHEKEIEEKEMHLSNLVNAMVPGLPQ